MKKLLLMVLLAVAAVALVAAPGWAGQVSLLSDTQLEAVYGGTGDITQTVDNSSDENVLTANTVNTAAALNCDDGCFRNQTGATSGVNLQITMHSISTQQSNAAANTGSGTVSTLNQANVAFSRTGSIN